MPAPTVAEVRTLCPELDAATYPDMRVETAIVLAGQIAASSLAVWIYTAAHLLVLGQEAIVDGGRGEVLSDTLGPRSASYKEQASREGDAFFTTTPYGRLALAMLGRNVRAQFSVYFG